jgi:hypothetical protein
MGIRRFSGGTYINNNKTGNQIRADGVGITIAASFIEEFS